MSPETFSDGSAESDGSPVNLFGFNLEFLGPEISENNYHTGFVRNIKCCLSLQIVRLFLSNFLKLTLSGKVNIFSAFPVQTRSLKRN